MGFRLPVVGYVAPRGVGGENAPGNPYNVENISSVNRQIDRIRVVYENNRDSREFSYGDKLDLHNAFRYAEFEDSRSARTKMTAVLKSLPQGGFIVTPNIKHIMDSSDVSKAVVRCGRTRFTGFIFADEINSMIIESIKHIKIITEMAMENMESINRSIPQPGSKKPNQKPV